MVVSPEQPDGTALLLEPNGNLNTKAFQESIYKAGLPVIVFDVDDIQKEYEKLKKHGVVFRKQPTKTEWRIETLFKDTCSNLIQLHQV